MEEIVEEEIEEEPVRREPSKPRTSIWDRLRTLTDRIEGGLVEEDDDDDDVLRDDRN